MVDALGRARRLLNQGGRVIDIHPTAASAVVLVDDVAAGVVDSHDGPARHQAATDAIASAVHQRMFRLVGALEFDFSVYADSLDELQEHITEDWREAKIGDETMVRAREAFVGRPRARARVRERVRITCLEP
jgi:hypothetical protein